MNILSTGALVCIYCVLPPDVDTASHTQDLSVLMLLFYYDIFSYETLSTGFFISRSSLLLFWYEHFWCLIILIKMLFLDGGKLRGESEWKHIFCCTFVIGFMLVFGGGCLLCMHDGGEGSHSCVNFNKRSALKYSMVVAITLVGKQSPWYGDRIIEFWLSSIFINWWKFMARN